MILRSCSIALLLVAFLWPTLLVAPNASTAASLHVASLGLAWLHWHQPDASALGRSGFRLVLILNAIGLAFAFITI